MGKAIGKYFIYFYSIESMAHGSKQEWFEAKAGISSKSVPDSNQQEEVALEDTVLQVALMEDVKLLTNQTEDIHETVIDPIKDAADLWEDIPLDEELKDVDIDAILAVNFDSETDL